MGRITGVLIALVLALTLPASAEATFSGQNGKIAYVNGGDIWTMNPDGSGQVNLTNDAATQGSPSWSPDGTQIAFEQGGAIWRMQADGANRLFVSTGPTSARDPAWSPDGTKLAFTNGGSMFLVNQDGTGLTNVPGAAVNNDPDWSPAGDLIAYNSTPNAGPAVPALYVVKPDGTGNQPVPQDGNYGSESSSWAPDAQRLAFVWSGQICPTPADCPYNGLNTIKRDLTDLQHLPGGGAGIAYSPDGSRFTYFLANTIYTMNIDGSGASGGLATGTEPDWQPILRGYARPKSASPFHASLVPAYEPCTTPNRQHAAPMSFGSCNPPAPTSDFATVGTPDANSQPAKSVGSLKLKAIGEVPINTGNGNQSDLEIDVSFTDVRSKPTPTSDYTAGLRAQMSLQVTDKNNTPHPGGPGPATVVPLSFEFDVPCATTADTTIGGQCTLDTTANALVPGQVLEFQRAIWQLGEVAVHDGGTDGNPTTEGDNTLFATQGVFIP